MEKKKAKFGKKLAKNWRKIGKFGEIWGKLGKKMMREMSENEEENSKKMCEC
jgi:hypothetical protein